jgi:hypothetical protein
MREDYAEVKPLTGAHGTAGASWQHPARTSAGTIQFNHRWTQMNTDKDRRGSENAENFSKGQIRIKTKSKIKIRITIQRESLRAGSRALCCKSDCPYALADQDSVHGFNRAP